MMKYYASFLVAAVVAVCSGCGAEIEPAQERKDVPRPTEIIEFSAADDAEAVVLSDDEVRTSAESVVADFNLDGIDDVAIIQEAEGDAKEVVVYIGKKEGAKKGRALTFGMAGSIHSVWNGRIAGIATSRRKKYTDLIILVQREGGPTQMIHYRNSGDKFVLVSDTQTSED